eukprot:TRINITY_DN496_c1_g1_i1.p1 TRINITY_DN496_c1_g1~~TRINITY_DN496_c1_g1_i1.p1  ORF type:complete len:680 (-),score=73.27 TRINITY_DN496_c1_g1_i1:882-2921(-)
MPFTDADRGLLGGVHTAIQMPSGGPIGTVVEGIKGAFSSSGAGSIGEIVAKALKDFFEQTIASLNPSEDTLKQIGTIFGKVVDACSNPGIFEPIVTAWKTFFAAVSDWLEHAGNVLLQEILKAWRVLCTAVVDALEAIRDVLVLFIKEVQRFLLMIRDELAEFFKTQFNNLATLANLKSILPHALIAGPMDALAAVEGLAKLSAAAGTKLSLDVADRIDFVTHSLKELIKIVTDNNSVAIFLFGQLIEEPTKVVTDILNGSSPEDALVSFIVDVLNPSELIDEIKKGFTIAGFANWIQLPGGIPTGKLNLWLNDASTYLDTVHPSSLEREFRTRLIAAFDAYICKVMNDTRAQAPLSSIDGQASTGILTDMICVFFDTVISFVIEPKCFPIIEADWDNFEDVGWKLARFSSRSIRASIRAAIGSGLRGVWAWSLYNENLIEGIAAALGSIFAPIIEGALKWMTWSIEVLTVYPKGRFPAAQLPNALELERWSSLETVGLSIDPLDRLEYVAYVRHNRLLAGWSAAEQDALMKIAAAQLLNGVPDTNPLAVPNPNVSLAVNGLIRDIGAYIDVCYRRFHLESIFPNLAIAEVEGFNPYDELSTTEEPFFNNGHLVIKVRSSSFPSLPLPVLRVYHPCGVAVMAPEGNHYILRLPVEDYRESITVRVLSSRGGRLSRRVSR